jgi:hypothetical protein
MSCFDNVVDDYLRAAARKETSGKTVTFYLGGAGRPEFQWSSTTCEGPGHGHAPPLYYNPHCVLETCVPAIPAAPQST